MAERVDGLGHDGDGPTSLRSAVSFGEDGNRAGTLLCLLRAMQKSEVRGNEEQGREGKLRLALKTGGGVVYRRQRARGRGTGMLGGDWADTRWLPVRRPEVDPSWSQEERSVN
jgi:hypothetical protein